MDAHLSVYLSFQQEGRIIQDDEQLKAIHHHRRMGWERHLPHELPTYLPTYTSK